MMGRPQASVAYGAVIVVLAAMLGVIVASPAPETRVGAIALLVLVALVWNPLLALPVVLLMFCLPLNMSTAELGLAALATCGVSAMLVTLERVFSHERLGLSPSAIIACLILVWICFGVTYTPFPNSVLARAVFFGAGVALAYAFGAKWSHDMRKIRIALGATIAILAMESALAVVQFAFRSPLLPDTWLAPHALEASTSIPGTFRAAGTFQHPNSLTVTLLLGAPIAAWWVARRSQSLMWVPLLMLAGTLATGSRTGVVGVLALVIGGVWIQGAVSRKRALALASLVIAAIPLSAIPQLNSMLARLPLIGGSVTTRDAASNVSRGAYIRAAYRGWREHVLVGNGLGTSKDLGVYYGGDAGLGAHNTPLDLLQGGGIVLGVLVFIALISWWRVSCRGLSLRPTYLSLCLPAVIVAGMFESLIQGLWAVLIPVLWVLARADSRDGHKAVGVLGCAGDA